MGESTFSLWCGQAGLVHNGSQIDRTGWDFYVEFPSISTLRADELHAAAIECKVQVKASDKRHRKLALKLSNLRRLITAQMPAIFVFIEFDKAETAQRAFVIHVDSSIIERTLKRIHEIEQNEGRTDHNKRTITVVYGDEHQLNPLTGEALKSRIESIVPNGMADYVSRKKAFLESIGFENGFAKFTFKTEDDQNLQDLIAVSIGARKSVAIKDFIGFHTRFGIPSKSPMINCAGANLEMPDLKPTAKGVVRFREDRLSPSLAFDCKLFVSPLNLALPENLAKMRIEGECFDLVMNPYTGAAEYMFDIGTGMSLPVTQLRDIVRLLYIIRSSSRRLTVEFSFESYPPFEMTLNSSNKPFDLSKELQALECAVDILSKFNVVEPVKTNLHEMSRHAQAISQFHSVLSPGSSTFKVEFGVRGNGFNSGRRVACLSLTTVRIGALVLGVILVITGTVTQLPEGKYQLLASDASIERRLVSDAKGVIRKEDLVAAIELVEAKYEPDFEVVTMFDKA
jgi:hypothetical protein